MMGSSVQVCYGQQVPETESSSQRVRYPGCASRIFVHGGCRSWFLAASSQEQLCQGKPAAVPPAKSQLEKG